MEDFEPHTLVEYLCPVTKKVDMELAGLMWKESRPSAPKAQSGSWLLGLVAEMDQRLDRKRGVDQNQLSA